MLSKISKQRLDEVLVKRQLAGSREQAQRMILAGLVTVEGTRVEKRAALVSGQAAIVVEGPASPFVSRGGEKLEAALNAFSIHVADRIVLDVGASTGGFTDCLLQHGAGRVYAVDVGYGQLDWNLRNDDRVVVLERCNIRHLDHTAVPEPIQLVVIDVSFISLRMVLPCVVKFLASVATVVALVKPQFEAGIKQVGRGGVVRDDGVRKDAARRIRETAQQLGFECLGLFDSPVQGKKGNREIFLGLRWTGGDSASSCLS
ncbi:MAG: TlyA family RNA methyltransferase [Nitrospira sp. SB0667_bin_9]|nr:TlyA family RNA methyltransferase [Nitrospira sp. SB0667_bin_9]MYD30492.1 TlyA family RNA methyltransferase [Nitrospira sp. SB0661_bin_20]MYJ23329.1 TlyA family RNA methyltransferase [Nitrospira sp. SB0673_bin_12]